MTDSSTSTAGDPSGNDYVVVARRYRPQLFEELIGQEHVARALTGAINSERVGHAYLFTGARGVGKTSAARILAKALNCAEGTSPTPCNQCEVCLSVGSGDDVDVLEIDGASNRGIDEIRQLRQNVAVRPSRSRFKIYIIDEVHMLTKEAFNALLKTLEEPPEHVKFIFATTEPNKIPVTILSRCQRYDFAGIDAVAIQLRLTQIAEAEGVVIESEAAQILAMRACGSMRDSQSLLEQLLATGGKSISAAEVTSMLGIASAARLGRILKPLVESNAGEALAELDAAIVDGAEISQLVDQLLGYFRDVMTQAVGCDADRMLYALPGQHAEVREHAQQLGINKLLAMAQILDQTASRMRLSTQTRTLAEMAIVRLCHLEDLDDLATLVSQLRDMPETVAGEKPAKKNGGDKRPVTPAVPREVKKVEEVERVEEVRKVEEVKRVEEVGKVEVEKVEEVVVESETVLSAGNLSSENVDEIWKRSLASLSGLLVDHAAMAGELKVQDDGKLVVGFPSKAYTDYCAKPANRSRLEAALREACGQPVQLVLQTDARIDTPTLHVPKRKSRREQEAEMVAQPFVKKAMQLFDVDPSKLRLVPPKDDMKHV